MRFLIHGLSCPFLLVGIGERGIGFLVFLSMSKGSACQMSLAYSWMVLSLENLPTLAMLASAIPHHFFWSCTSEYQAQYNQWTTVCCTPHVLDYSVQRMYTCNTCVQYRQNDVIYPSTHITLHNLPQLK